MELITSPSMNVWPFTHEQYSSCFIIFWFCISLPPPHLFEFHSFSKERDAEAELILEFLRPELEKASEDVGGKEEMGLSEKLKFNKLKIKGPHTAGKGRGRFGT